MKKESTSKNENVNEQFGANTWFVEALFNEYKSNPESLPEQWKKYFNIESKGSEKAMKTSFKMPEPVEDDELKIIAGSSAKILDNMNSSLSIPVATSQRSIPVKLLEENRILINNIYGKLHSKKISFTHLIAFAIVKALKKYSSLNNAFTEKEGKPHLIKRKHINLGVAIDVERKDGSRSLLVPNIKNAETLSFSKFVEVYEDLVKRSRTGQIDPSEFLGTTCSLTNPGTIGTVASIPRLMVGQGVIIATGAIQYPAEYQAMSPETISTLGISKILTITSTYDHRIIQGAESGMFLKEIHDLLLGENNFYDEIFSDLKIPLKPVNWETDIQPQGFNRNVNVEEIEKQAKVIQLINMFRVRGHLVASIDPLGANSVYHPELDPSFHKLTLWDLDRTFVTGGFGGIKTATLRQILAKLQKTYCDKIGVEYMHIQNPEEKSWLQFAMEPSENSPKFSIDEKKQILKKLIEAEAFEHFIHNRFIGHKRFSIEGSETVIAALDFIINYLAEYDVNEVVLGMAHRGRLNVLANIIGKSYDSIFSEFEDVLDPDSFAGSGDVKYHLGASGTHKTISGKSVAVSVTSNPSHLEWVNPVVQGVVRAKQKRKNDKERRKIIPLLLHGDAAFAGQGVVAETLNLSQLNGYRTGGTIHLIVNNQIGFTTTPEDARSSVYATDVAKMVQSPIFHVNGDDPEAVLWTIKIAVDYRQKFNKDVVIDVLGYRRHGHNEGDEPGFTQPLLYNKIKNHPSVKNIYSQKLLSDKILEAVNVESIQSEIEKKLNSSLEKVKKRRVELNLDVPLVLSKEKIQTSTQTTITHIDKPTLDELILRSTAIKNSFVVHPKLKKFLEKRREFINETGLADWAMGENLAFASLLFEGTPIRLSGQDSVRGTFSQRHLALTDVNSGEEFIPLNSMYNKQAKIEAFDSLLSEAAVLGFEYGYSTADLQSLVLWEAQFGDFANGAQVIIDNFIVASYEKWKLPNNLVLLLPHGFEGQGPEHSSARLERFLILCAQENMEVCYPTTPAQYFHLLRRHVKKVNKRPLIIMAPKSLLRLPEARSQRVEFLEGTFKEVLDEKELLDINSVKRVLLTSGKIYYELLKYRADNNINDTVILRLEQFYPYPTDEITRLLEKYKSAGKVIWVQEEPRNMGAWSFLSTRLFEDLADGQRLLYAGRSESASPAVGSYRISERQQEGLIKEAFEK
ncbi:MAG: multifunctional oxoglutarate decarboxylase/oxoglutarate dehydrogenase thiamine pyrophosphate-binding subunit/dihydrolipoyllysine-residue succinyltransferase subunit [Ignavibacteriaceae bacterium]|nr:multifunctional oxoglutarate decarboxylase/oxoglutarate dehydrogenase thiamine pyrophosphate-binding subunit/dihydrolipoyllysine-residue succinyltransferase subunit [Ignavibacteriaceae bacterium]